MANRDVKRCSMSQSIREMEIKTTVREDLTPVRMATIKKNKHWQRHGENETLTHCAWECKLMQPLWKTAWRFLKKPKIELLPDLAIPVLGIYATFAFDLENVNK